MRDERLCTAVCERSCGERRLDLRGQPGERLLRLVGRDGRDVDGDSYSDVIVGARITTTARPMRGVRLCTAGLRAVSGERRVGRGEQPGDRPFRYLRGYGGGRERDGYADVIVGAPFCDNGQTDEGRAFVYEGSAGGLSPSAGWTAESGQDNAWFGSFVSTAVT